MPCRYNTPPSDDTTITATPTTSINRETRNVFGFVPVLADIIALAFGSCNYIRSNRHSTLTFLYTRFLHVLECCYISLNRFTGTMVPITFFFRNTIFKLKYLFFCYISPTAYVGSNESWLNFTSETKVTYSLQSRHTKNIGLWTYCFDCDFFFF